MRYYYCEDKKHYCGRYKGIDVWQCGQMIGDNWYGTFYVTIRKGKSGRRMKVKDSECRSWESLKEYINKNINDLIPLE